MRGGEGGANKMSRVGAKGQRTVQTHANINRAQMNAVDVQKQPRNYITSPII